MSTLGFAGHYEFDSGTGGVATYVGPGGPITNQATMGSDGWYGTGAGVALGELSPGQTASATFTGEITLRYRWVEDGPWDLPPSVSIIKMEAAAGAVGQVRDCTTGLPETIIEDESTKFANGVVRRLEAPDIDGNYTFTFNPSASGFVAYSNEPIHGPSVSAYVRVTIIPLKIAVFGVIREKALSCLAGQGIVAAVPSIYATVQQWKPPIGVVKQYVWGEWGYRDVVVNEAMQRWDYFEGRALQYLEQADCFGQSIAFIPHEIGPCFVSSMDQTVDPFHVEISVDVSVQFEGFNLGSATLTEFVDSYGPRLIERFSNSGVSYVKDDDSNVIGVASGSGELAGVSFQIAMSRPALFESLGPGRMGYCQLANVDRAIVRGGVTVVRLNTNDEDWLDNVFLYEPTDGNPSRFEDGWLEPAEVGQVQWQYATDSPSHIGGLPPLPVTSYTINDRYQMFFCYLPPPNLEVGITDWQGTAVHPWNWDVHVSRIWNESWPPISGSTFFENRYSNADRLLIWDKVFFNISN